MKSYWKIYFPLKKYSSLWKKIIYLASQFYADTFFRQTISIGRFVASLPIYAASL